MRFATLEKRAGIALPIPRAHVCGLGSKSPAPMSSRRSADGTAGSWTPGRGPDAISAGPPHMRVRCRRRQRRELPSANTQLCPMGPARACRAAAESAPPRTCHRPRVSRAEFVAGEGSLLRGFLMPQAFISRPANETNAAPAIERAATILNQMPT